MLIVWKYHWVQENLCKRKWWVA